MPPPPPAEPPAEPAAEADEAMLRRWALPVVEGAKAGRGTCLVVGGSTLTPGAVLLAAVGALRAGAGKVQVATARSAAATLAVAVPEALVIGLEEDGDGQIIPSSVDGLASALDGATSVLVGPGCLDAGLAFELLTRVAARLDDGVLVVDAKALPGLADDPGALRSLGGRAIVTPNTKEVAALAGRGDEVGDDDLDGLAAHLAGCLGAVVAAKGADTRVAAPGGRRWRVPGGDPACRQQARAMSWPGSWPGWRREPTSRRRPRSTPCTSTPRPAGDWPSGWAASASWPASCSTTSPGSSTRWLRDGAPRGRTAPGPRTT